MRMCNRKNMHVFCKQNVITHAHSNFLHVLCNMELTGLNILLANELITELVVCCMYTASGPLLLTHTCNKKSQVLISYSFKMISNILICFIID